MRRTCFIGNSHLAAFKLGLNRLIDDGDVEASSVMTVGTPKNWLARAEIKGGHIVPTSERMQKDFLWTTGGQATVDLQHFDAFVIAAGRGPRSLDCYVAHEAPSPFVSRALVRAVLAQILRGWQHALARRIVKAAPQARVLFVGAPPFAESDPDAVRFLEALEEPGALDALRRLRDYIDDELGALQRERIAFVRVPPELLESRQIFVRERYTRGSVRLAEGRRQAPPTTTAT